MLFNKYQYTDADIQKRGYAQSVSCKDEQGNQFDEMWFLWKK